MAERPLLVAKLIQAEGKISKASIVKRLNQDRGGASLFTMDSMHTTFHFLCAAKLVEKAGNCTYKISALFLETHSPQQLEFAVEREWQKKQLAEQKKKPEAKKRSKCVIAKHVVLVRQAS